MCLLRATLRMKRECNPRHRQLLRARQAPPNPRVGSGDGLPSGHRSFVLCHVPSPKTYHTGKRDLLRRRGRPLRRARLSVALWVLQMIDVQSPCLSTRTWQYAWKTTAQVPDRQWVVDEAPKAIHSKALFRTARTSLCQCPRPKVVQTASSRTQWRGIAPTSASGERRGGVGHLLRGQPGLTV